MMYAEMVASLGQLLEHPQKKRREKEKKKKKKNLWVFDIYLAVFRVG